MHKRLGWVSNVGRALNAILFSLLTLFTHYRDHCEYLESELKEIANLNPKENASSGTTTQKRSGGAKFGLFLLITGCLALTAVGAMYALRLKKRRDAMNNMPGFNENIAPNSGITVYNKPNLDNNAVVVDLGPNQDLDGNVLHNVDII
jgi:hypothetical protein